MNFLGGIKASVRSVMHAIAKFLDRASGGRITPNGITIFGVVMHIPIAIFIAAGWWWQAAILLVVFGLFDTLDGELARLTKKTSAVGMILDSSTDRLKEVMLYSGLVYWFASFGAQRGAAMAALAMGASICVSYVKSRGEIAVATADKSKKYDHATLNKKVFAAGLFPFEIRMALLVIGLILGAIFNENPAIIMFVVVSIIAVGSLVTFVQRLINIQKHL